MSTLVSSIDYQRVHLFLLEATKHVLAKAFLIKQNQVR